MASKKNDYGNDSISSLKGADRVRKRPGVIFGSDGIEGCEHSVFEILSNSIDEAREGRGDQIVITRFADGSVEVQDFGAGIPVDEALAKRILTESEITIDIRLRDGSAEARAFGCDLTYDYVKINGDYRS